LIVAKSLAGHTVPEGAASKLGWRGQWSPLQFQLQL